MKESISKRLIHIANLVPKATCVADIGADHGKLLAYLAHQKKIKKGIAGEVNRGPYQNASAFVKKCGLDALIDVRMGNGLEVIQEPVDVVIIAGMGGSLIVDILEAGKNKLTDVSRLVLQPNIGEHRVRQWLDQNEWTMVHEEIVLEDGIYYEILAASPRTGADDVYENLPLSKERFFQIGALLWKNRDPLLLPKQQLSHQRRREVSQQLQHAKGAEPKKLELQSEIEDREKVIQWLSKEKN